MIINLCDSQDLFDRFSNRAGVFSEPEAAAIFSSLMHIVILSRIKFCLILEAKLADFGSVEWFVMSDVGTMTGMWRRRFCPAESITRRLMYGVPERLENVRLC
ncbi:hypothetical protein Hanom_Chr16g01501391 [Helianthus anomalus]